MFPKIHILSYDDARFALSLGGHKNFSHVVSLNDPGCPPPDGVARVPLHLVHHFHDVTNSEGGYAPPTRKQVEEIVRFGMTMTPESLAIIHCAAGISRSSSAALAIIASKLSPGNRSASFAIHHLLSIKQAIRPNPLVVRYTDDFLGYNGALVEAHRSIFVNG